MFFLSTPFLVGAVYGYEIFTIYEIDFDAVSGCDIVRQHELNLHHGILPKEFLEVCACDEEVFGFDLTQRDEHGEAPVYEIYSKTKFADNFIDFLIKFIEMDTM